MNLSAGVLNKPLTKSQKQVYDFITEKYAERGYAPTFREVQGHFGFSSLGTVYSYVKQLKAKGYLIEGKQQPIALNPDMAPLKILGQSSDLFLIGSIAAGFPIETFAEPATFSLPPSLVPRPDSSYLLKVKGDTLVEECLLDGDLLVVDTGTEALYGELIAGLLIEGGAFVKRYFPEGPYVRLENSAGKYEPIVVGAEEIEILGVVVGMMRQTGRNTGSLELF